MKTHRWEDLKKRKLTPQKLAAIDRKVQKEVLLLNLRELRDMAGKTQAEVADIAEMTQSELSRTERREDHLLSTLRKYVKALGGELEVVAVFDHRRVRLHGV